MTTLTASTLAKTAVTSPAGTEILRLIDGTTAKQITLSNLRTYKFRRSAVNSMWYQL